MPDSNQIIDNLERIRPEKEDSKLDISNELLTERLANSEKTRKDTAAKHKKEKFLLIFIAAVFFLLFIEAAEGAPNWVIILTALTGVLLLLWVKAKWSGFRPLATRLGTWLDLLYKIAEQHCLKNSPQPEKPKKEYEELPS